jgi:hypothetical protein
VRSLTPLLAVVVAAPAAAQTTAADTVGIRNVLWEIRR